MVLHIQDLRLLQIRAYLTKARLLGTPPHDLPTRGLTDLPILVRSKYDAGEATTRRDYFELHFETARLRSLCANELSVLCANEFCAHCAMYLFRHLHNLHGCGRSLRTPPPSVACLYANWRGINLCITRCEPRILLQTAGTVPAPIHTAHSATRATELCAILLCFLKAGKIKFLKIETLL